MRERMSFVIATSQSESGVSTTMMHDFDQLTRLGFLRVRLTVDGACGQLRG